MKKSTRKKIDEIAEGWYKRAQNLAAVYKSPHSDYKRKQKAFRLMTEMSVRLTSIALILQPKMPSSFKKSGSIIKPNPKPVKLIKL